MDSPSSSEIRPIDYTIPEIVLNSVGVPDIDIVGANKLPNGGFLCNFCSKFMKNKNDMRRHIRTHTGETLFECKICGRRFKRNFPLKIHMKTVHKDEVY